MVCRGEFRNSLRINVMLKTWHRGKLGLLDEERRSERRTFVLFGTDIDNVLFYFTNVLFDT